MKDVYQTMKELNIVIPKAPAKGGVYTSVVDFANGKLLYCSGCGPKIENINYIGKLGRDLTVEQGQESAKNCMLNLLAILEAKIGDLNKIKRFVKVLAFVNSTDDFTEQPQVINGGSELLFQIFGEDGLAARSAISSNALPGGIATEIEALVELK